MRRSVHLHDDRRRAFVGVPSCGDIDQDVHSRRPRDGRRRTDERHLRLRRGDESEVRGGVGDVSLRGGDPPESRSIDTHRPIRHRRPRHHSRRVVRARATPTLRSPRRRVRRRRRFACHPPLVTLREPNRGVAELRSSLSSERARVERGERDAPQRARLAARHLAHRGGGPQRVHRARARRIDEDTTRPRARKYAEGARRTSRPPRNDIQNIQNDARPSCLRSARSVAKAHIASAASRAANARQRTPSPPRTRWRRRRHVVRDAPRRTRVPPRPHRAARGVRRGTSATPRSPLSRARTRLARRQAIRFWISRRRANRSRTTRLPTREPRRATRTRAPTAPSPRGRRRAHADSDPRVGRAAAAPASTYSTVRARSTRPIAAAAHVAIAASRGASGRRRRASVGVVSVGVASVGVAARFSASMSAARSAGPVGNASAPSVA